VFAELVVGEFLQLTEQGRCKMTSIAFFRHSTRCTACGEDCIAPVRSQYESAEEVHHFWCCWSCGSEFETMDHLNPTANVPTELVRKHVPALVAA
jgi:uncharacterized protein with PIN domain